MVKTVENAVTECTIQAVLMRWIMEEKHHEYILPNSNQFFSWEADLLSVTKAGLIHEFEIKLNIYDFKADAKKYKHYKIGYQTYSPAYFWYATYDFEIDPPEKAGWINITKTESTINYGWTVTIKKEAPRLNNWKVTPQKVEQIARILSWRLCNIFEQRHLRK